MYDDDDDEDKKRSYDVVWSWLKKERKRCDIIADSLMYVHIFSESWPVSVKTANLPYNLFNM